MAENDIVGDDIDQNDIDDDEKTNNKLHISGLSFDSTEDSIRNVFEAHGNIQEINIITDKATGKSKGYAFVTYDSTDSAGNAVKDLNGTNLDGRTIGVSIARPKGSGGGRGRGGRRGSSRGGRRGGASYGSFKDRNDGGRGGGRGRRGGGGRSSGGGGGRRGGGRGRR